VPVGGFALVGVPTDRNSSFLRGPAAAPPAIRAVLFGAAGNMFTEGGLDVGAPGVIDDRGDLPLTESDGDFAVIESTFREMGGPFVALGGDHSITYPILRGLCAGREPVNVLHFDAHPDLYDVFEGNHLSHACPSRGSWRTAWRAAWCRWASAPPRRTSATRPGASAWRRSSLTRSRPRPCPSRTVPST
jgi:arginase family enzyme